MPRRAVTFDTVREIGRLLPGAEESTAYGSPALKVRGRMFACMAIHKSAAPNTLVVQLDFDERDELVAAQPDVYYLTDHYLDSSSVLVRLDRVRRDALADLLRTAHRQVSARSTRRSTSRSRRSRR
jgi:hypothetical protein